MLDDYFEIDQRYKWSKTNHWRSTEFQTMERTDGGYKDKLKWDGPENTEGNWNTKR